MEVGGEDGVGFLGREVSVELVFFGGREGFGVCFERQGDFCEKAFVILVREEGPGMLGG